MTSRLLPSQAAVSPAVLDRPLRPAVAGSAAERLLRVFSAYEADEADAARFRARQLQAMLRLTPVAMLTNMVNATIVCTVFWAQASHAFLIGWACIVVLMSALGLRGWYRARKRPMRATASRRAIHHAVVQAGALGGAWALLPAGLFAGIDPGSQYVMGVVITGMICAGGFALYNVPAAATSWVTLLGAGSAVALWRSDSNEANGVAVMLVMYCGIVIYSVWASAKTFGARLVAEARADRQNEVIGLLLREFEDHGSDLLWELDARGCFRNVSQRLAATLGFSPASLQRRPATDLLARTLPDTADARQHWDTLLQHLASGTAFREQIVSLSGPGGPNWWSLSARALFDESGRATGWRGVAANVTDKHLAHRRLSWLAHNDDLTGLVNRTQFRELLQALLHGRPADIPPLAVVSVDLDDFKRVNDTRGHAAGDHYLRVFGERLMSVTRHSDTVARLGGDEFAILVRGASGEEEVRMLLDRVLAALAQPCEVAGHTLPLRASMGVAMAPRDGGDVDTLMNHADVALYASKQAGGHRYGFFHHAMAEVGRRRTTLQEALRGAIGRGELRLEYQPQVATADGVVHGFEALLRWCHAEHGNVSPAEFVPIAESAGLMPEIGEWVLVEACRQAASWPGHVNVSINVSARQLKGRDFVARVEAAAQGLRSGRVELEITESVLIDDVEAVIGTLQALRARGFRIALDDFGTGYSALGYLRRFPFDTLKIDRSFVHDLANEGEARVIVDTILAMSRALRMTTIAEGVESPVEAQMLRERGCAVLQGFLISRSLPASDVAPFLADWARRGEDVLAGV